MNINLVDMYIYSLDHNQDHYYYTYEFYNENQFFYQFFISVKSNNNTIIDIELNVENDFKYRNEDKLINDILSYINILINRIYNSYLVNYVEGR